MRWGIFGTFFGHGLWALSIKQGWFKYFQGVGITGTATIEMLLLVIGLLDILVAFVILFKPYKWVLGWAIFWGFTTAMIRPITASEGFFSIELLDFVERGANFMLPAALLIYRGWPKNLKEWFTW